MAQRQNQGSACQLSKQPCNHQKKRLRTGMVVLGLLLLLTTLVLHDLGGLQALEPARRGHATALQTCQISRPRHCNCTLRLRSLLHMCSRGSERKTGKRWHSDLAAAVEAGGEAGGGGGPETSSRFLLRDGDGAGDRGGEVGGAGRNWAARV